MSEQASKAEWYYVGHYGQLGPLTLSQLTELASDGVVSRETYVWRTGMSDWTQASSVPELRQYVVGMPELPPPQSPLAPPPTPTRLGSSSQTFPAYSVNSESGWQYIQTHAPRSDKNRLTGGLLNFIPGVGRLYLGYMAHGILQIFTTVFCGIGVLWAWIDAIYILAGGVRLDGYGRRLED